MSSTLGGGSSELTVLVYVFLFIGSTILFVLWGTRMQAFAALGQVKRGLQKLSDVRDQTKKEAVDYMIKNCNVPKEAQARLEQTLEYFTIMPVDMDPNGLVRKVEHVVTLQDDRMREEIRHMAPKADPIQLSVAQNILQVATSINQVFKLVRHLYIQGEKTKSYFIVVQLQMIMPILLQEVDALASSIDAYKQSQPIGDGFGAMVAGRFMHGKDNTAIERETLYSVTEYKGRTLVIMKAEGPMAVVGRLHIGVEKLLTMNGNKRVDCLIMIDAALKLEGENSGEIAEGIGAAIGGIGVEKFRIEKAAVLADIPMYAVVAKQSLIEVVSVMSREVAEASDKAVAVVQRIIEEKTKEGNTVLIVGVGNTLGIGQ